MLAAFDKGLRVGVQAYELLAGCCLRTPEGGGGEGGGCLALAQPRPTDPPRHIRKNFLRQKMKFIKGAGNLRPISGTQTFVLASNPTTPDWGEGGVSFSNSLAGSS